MADTPTGETTFLPDPADLFQKYQELQSYVGWTETDAERAKALLPDLRGHIPSLIDDFYEEITRHPDTNRVMTGGQIQVERLKATLRRWLEDLFIGPYDEQFVVRRWTIGRRHVEIGLDQVYTNVALSRLRSGLCRCLCEQTKCSAQELAAACHTLSVLIDLDLALIEDAYQTEYVRRVQSIERLAVMGQMAGGIAHEVRNPLNVIKTSAYFLRNAQNPPPEKVQEHLERIERQVRIANDVISSLSNFARSNNTALKPFRLDEHLREVLADLEHDSKIQITFDCPSESPIVVADESQIRIVIGNLLRNAIEAMPEGGRLNLSIHPHQDWVEMVVSDTGKGIPFEHLTRIMEPFFSTKSDGIGLGLSMAKAIVEKNEGAILVESVPDQGTSFKIRLRRGPNGTSSI
ncbi:MAG: GHKL domain-containing protein [Planctomycetaceae bacterium]|nr:GHKL domain-containing protein [Planctomycetaceae bacterium]